MKFARLICCILVAVLMMSLFVGARAIAQTWPPVPQDEPAALDKRIAELRQAGKFSEAIPLAQRALANRENALGPNHLSVAVSLNNLAELYRVQGRYADAEPLYKRSLAIVERAMGADHRDVATLANNLALLYDHQGRYVDAEPLYKRSLAIGEKALGPDHPQVAMLLNNLALLYDHQGRYADAEPLYKRSLAISEKALGPDHPQIALLLNNLALLYDNRGRYADAEPLYKRSLAIGERALGPDHPDVATSLNNLAEVYRREGRYADAEPLYKRSLAIREKGLGPNHPSVAQSLGNLALLYDNQGRYADAEPLFKRSLAINEKALGSDHPAVVTSLENLAGLYGHQGRYADAEPLFKRSLVTGEKALGPDHPHVATLLDNLASLYTDRDRYADAEPLYRRALEIREKALGPDHPDVARSLHDLAGLYVNQGRYADAEPLYKRALMIQERRLGPDHPDVARSLGDLAPIYREQGRYADAELLYKRSLVILEKGLGPSDPQVAWSLNNLAELYRVQGRYADAEALYSRALAIREKTLGPDHRDVAVSLNNLALLYDNEGRYADAEPLLKRALAILEKGLGPDHRFVARSLDNLAGVYDSQGRYADAEPLYKRSLAISEKALGPDHRDVGTSLNNLAVLYDHQGRYADAEPLYKRSIAISEKALGPDHPAVAVSFNSLALLYDRQGRYADALPLVQKTIAAARAVPPIAVPVLFGAQEKGLISASQARDGALDVVQRASQTPAAAAVNKLGARLAAGSDRLAQLVRKDQDLAAETETLDKAIVAAVSKEPSQRDATGEQRIRDRLAAIATERQALEKVFAAEFPDYAAFSHPQPLTVKDIQDLLSGDEALVLFALGDKETYVFAVTLTAVAAKVIPLGASALSEKVAAFRRGLDVEALRQSAEAGKPVLFDLGLANELYAALIGPVEEVVKDARHVMVVPAGPLTSLPFHLLVTEKPATPIPQLKDIGSYRDAAWLIKRQAVSMLPALASLKALRQVARRNPGAKPLVGFGDPVFDPAERAKALAERRPSRTRVAVTRGYGDFWQGASIDRAKLAQYLPSLLDTADELKAVAGKLGAAAGDIHLGSDASEATVKRTGLADYRVVYFATHGLVAGDVAGLGEPSLALTIPKQPTELDDGLLTASEVAQLKLNADWVVLSACNTAAADKPGAEALSGLARAFFYAGARALLVSHWSVDSEAATRLTTATFAVLKADPKLGRAAALRIAMLTYMNDRASPLNAYPAFWGPFSIIGEGAAR
jgi:tetratricopeptide (TPR) repeat protein/CHAT domain-containing protein